MSNESYSRDWLWATMKEFDPHLKALQAEAENGAEWDGPLGIKQRMAYLVGWDRGINRGGIRANVRIDVNPLNEREALLQSREAYETAYWKLKTACDRFDGVVQR